MKVEKPSPWFRLRTRITRRIYREIWFGRTQRIGCYQIIKTRCDLSEIEAMEFVRKNTTIPVPKIIRIYQHGDKLDIVMKLVKGETLDVAWSKLDSSQKEAVVRELCGYIEQLRKLVPPADLIGSVGMSSGLDARLGGNRWGPFDSISKFHDYLRRDLPLDGIWSNVPEVVKVHARPQTYTIKFTHADLSPRNIMVKNGKITGIIDWEFSGWYPEYWEYTKTYHGWRPYLKDFYDILDRFTKTYPEELAAEREIWKRVDIFTYDKPTKTALAASGQCV